MRCPHALEPKCRELIEHPAFLRNPQRQHHVKGRNAIGRDDQQPVAEIVHVAHFPAREQGYGERRFQNYVIHIEPNSPVLLPVPIFKFYYILCGINQFTQ